MIQPLPIATTATAAPAQSIAPKKAVDFSTYEINDSSNIPPIEPVIYIDDAIFAVKGGISFISGVPKSGKSSLTPYIVGSALAPEGMEYDTIKINTIKTDKPIIYIDTEQHASSTKAIRDNIRKIFNIHDVSLFKTYNCTQNSPDENNELLTQLFKRYDAHLWIIDGIADFVKSVNDEEGGNAFIQSLMKYASETGTCIVLVIHENYGTGKLRGHLGSQAERKCSGSISVKKDREKGVHAIESKLIRYSGDFEPIYFQYSKEQSRFVSLTNDAVKALEKQKAAEQTESFGLLAAKLLPPSHPVRSKPDLEKSLMLIEPTIKSIKTAQRRITDMLESGFIELSHTEGRTKFFQLKSIPTPNTSNQLSL